MSIVGATFVSNWAEDVFTVPGGGGAVRVDSVGPVALYLENLVFDNNSAASDGGALFLSAPSGYAYVRGSTFERNFAGVLPCNSQTHVGGTSILSAAEFHRPVVRFLLYILLHKRFQDYYFWLCIFLVYRDNSLRVKYRARALLAESAMVKW